MPTQARCTPGDLPEALHFQPPGPDPSGAPSRIALCRGAAARVASPRHSKKACLLALVIAVATGVARAQDVTPERLKALEDALNAEHQRNDQQSKRIEELELTLVSVIGAQKEAEQQSLLNTEIERLVGEEVDRHLAATNRKESGRRTPLKVTGRMRLSNRVFGGDRISTDSSFEIEHLIVELTAQLDDRFRVKLSPGSSHIGELFVVEAYGAYRFDPALEVIAGRFTVPFSGAHAWGFPSDSFIEPYLPENSPKPFLYAPFWDEGVQITGRAPFGDQGQNEFYYAGYVTNGVDEDVISGIHKQFFGDNNKNKTLGGRASATLRLDDATRLAVGVAGMAGKYDRNNRLNFYALEADADFATGPFSIYLEAFARPTEIEGAVIENPAVSIVEVSRLYGFKARPSIRLADNLSLFLQLDQLEVHQAPTVGGQFSVLSLDKETFTVRTGVVGIKYDVTSNLRMVLEGGIFDRDATLGGDIRFIALSTIYSF